MKLKLVSLSDLIVNPSNDRHGELHSEEAAIVWLFRERNKHMINLASDIVKESSVYEPPLVAPHETKFLVFDGNRRVTRYKLLNNPRLAPTYELRILFSDLRNKWEGSFPKKLKCHIESDRDRIDSILFRRHTGSQGGVGQSTWDDRMKSNFVERTGKGSGFNVSEEIEKILSENNLLPNSHKIPRSTMNRLLSSEEFRNRIGISIKNKKLSFTHEKSVVNNALSRIAQDLSYKKIVLMNVWDSKGKHRYLDELDAEGILPTPCHLLKPTQNNPHSKTRKQAQRLQTLPSTRKTLIPQTEFGLSWPARLQRHKAIWEELQYHLLLTTHLNAIAVLFRVLLELSVENYISQKSIQIPKNDKLSNKMLKVAHCLNTNKKIDDKQLGLIKKFSNADILCSADTFNRYVHSPSFAPSPEHLTSIWDSLAEYIVECLKA